MSRTLRSRIGQFLVAGIMAACCGGLLRPLPVRAHETIWLETELLRGVSGKCRPEADAKRQRTVPGWGLAGPGLAGEWTQGGESEWSSIACTPDDDQAEAWTEVAVPSAGPWRLWVRYRDWRGQTEQFVVRVEQQGRAPAEFVFGDKPVVDEDDELKVFWKWAFGWDVRTVTLAAGPATVRVRAHAKQPGHRQVDVVCLTTDTGYEPFHREKPGSATWSLLDDLRARPGVADQPLAVRTPAATVPAAWTIPTIRDQGFIYLWNISREKGRSWLDDFDLPATEGVRFPYGVAPELVDAFRAAYAGKPDVPIFSDPRIVPSFTAAGPSVLDDDRFVAWLAAEPRRLFANKINYQKILPLSDKARDNWAKFADRYVGGISGENLGYVTVDTEALHGKVRLAKNRADVLAALTAAYLPAIAGRAQTIFGETNPAPYRFTIPCQSVDMLCFAAVCRAWGARTVGYESSGNGPCLAMRLAFLRGSARQFGGPMATYRSCNFGDSSTIFAYHGSVFSSAKFDRPQGTASPTHFVLDTYYDLWGGAGMAWYKFDLWHQYFSGASLFFHEQGFDEFWVPGGRSTGKKSIELSPKGRLVDQFLEITRRHPERGVPFTPVAFLLDRAHGWEPNAFVPGYFGLDPALNPEVLVYDDHARMLREWFAVAYHPYGPRETELERAVNTVYVPGVFGNAFDVLVTAPGRTDILDAYPAVVMNGKVTLTEAWGNRLAAYVANGGTLLVSAGQLDGPGLAALRLPALGASGEDDRVRWLPQDRTIAGPRYRYQAIGEGEPLATASNGAVIAAVLPRGKGRVVLQSVPLGLSITGQATPLVALLLAHLRQGLMPVEVAGEVEWLLNRTPGGWIVTLLNPAGAGKPQHGIVPTDYAQRRAVRITTAHPVQRATEWLTDAPLEVRRGQGEQTIELIIPAGGVRVVELE